MQGHAIGAGFQLALACDLRVVADDVQFAMRETSLGLVPDLTGTQPLVDLVGYARALEICATGRFVHAEEAERIGLANLVVPADELDAAVRDLAAALLAAPRDAVIETKALLRGAGSRTYDEQRAGGARRPGPPAARPGRPHGLTCGPAPVPGAAGTGGAPRRPPAGPASGDQQGLARDLAGFDRAVRLRGLRQRERARDHRAEPPGRRLGQGVARQAG